MAKKERLKFLGKNPLFGIPKGVKVLAKNPLVGTTLPPKLKFPIVRVPRGPTVRWSIDYNKLFKRKK